jgi:hypothetical protein
MVHQYSPQVSTSLSLSPSLSPQPFTTPVQQVRTRASTPTVHQNYVSLPPSRCQPIASQGPKDWCRMGKKQVQTGSRWSWDETFSNRRWSSAQDYNIMSLDPSKSRYFLQALCHNFTIIWNK